VISSSIRLAVISEKEELEALQLRASLTNAGDRDALLANPDAIELPVDQIAAGTVFVAEQDGAIVGFATVLRRPDENAELDALFVDPDVRRGGIGRSLVVHCAKVACLQGAAALCVVGNPHAYDFYIACGFQVVGKTETRFGLGLLMRKML
jgi:N-acetylglutamate synthase-like GNAT family acetyltransferase